MLFVIDFQGLFGWGQRMDLTFKPMQNFSKNPLNNSGKVLKIKSRGQRNTYFLFQCWAVNILCGHNR